MARDAIKEEIEWNESIVYMVYDDIFDKFLTEEWV